MAKQDPKNTRKRPATTKGKTSTRAGRPDAKPAAVPAEWPTDARGGISESLFPVVGIGASAGGLEAIEQLLRSVPERSGMAFVVVQHLDPTYRGMLAELLQRNTPMPVVQAKDRMAVEPDHVYVIPPNKDMSLMHGKLHLLPQAAPRGLNLPIDFFFRSLAEDQQERAIAVILSGMGSDGTLGLRAIKEKGGAAFVQAAASARFDGMPRSAIETGLADVVAPVDELVARIMAYRHRLPQGYRSDASIEDKDLSALDKVFVLLRSQTGNDFSSYKKSTIYRRIERRMGLHQIDGIARYVRFLRENPREIELLFKELLIGVTAFFRDPLAWEQLKQEVIPALLAARPAGGELRAWVPACSTGEEAYSLAMVFKEAMDSHKPVRKLSLQIFATDLDHDAIEKARQGCFPNNIVADVSPERLRRFFVQDDSGYRVSKEIREMVVFAPQNIISDPPFTKLDLISCRNLLIYLSSELQKKLIPLFHYSLNPEGVLFLGSAETVGTFSGLFSALDPKARLYRRLYQPVSPIPIEFPSKLPAAGQRDSERSTAGRQAPPNLQSLADRVLVQNFSPVAVLCTDKGDLLYVSGRAGKYLEPAVGKANLNVFAMARQGLAFELSRAFAAALREDHVITVPGVEIGSNGNKQTIDLKIQKLSEPKELRGSVMIVFQDVVPAPESARPARSRRGGGSAREAALEQELQRAREDVHSAREEMQTSQEELKSTNEELQSTNEELQSTNEELTTSKEEMQSLNEELQTVNHELQAKVDELSRSNNDMKNLLNSTDIATLFLDGDLHVRRFTTPTARIIKLIPADIGRPVTDIASDLDYPQLAEHAREVLRTLVFRETQVETHDGRCFAVRIMPYRTLENVIDGVVITFTDASTSRSLETALRDQTDQNRQMDESLPSLGWKCRPDGAWDHVNRQWVDYTGIPGADQLGYRWLEQVHPDDRERVLEEWSAAVNAETRYETELRIRNAIGEHRWFKVLMMPIRAPEGAILKWYGTGTDIDGLRRAIDERHRAVERLTAVLESLTEGFVAVDGDLLITFVNSVAERMIDRERHELLGKSVFDALPGLAGAIGEKLRQALLDKRDLVIEPLLDIDALSGAFRLRAYPQRQPEGMSLFFDALGGGGRSSIAAQGRGT